MMENINYLNLNKNPIQISFMRDRTDEFKEIYHAHQGMELLYIHSGSGCVIVDGKMVEIKPESLFCFRPYHMHRTQVFIEKGPYVRSLFVFQPHILEQYLLPFEGLRSFFNKLWKEPIFPVCFSHIPENRMKALIDQCMAEDVSHDLRARFEAETLFLINLVSVIRQNYIMSSPGLHDKTHHMSNSSINKIFYWLEENFQEEFHLQNLARAVHLSPNYVSYLFLKQTGSCISDYIAARRIQEACMLLRTTSLSIQEIGYRIGLSNFSYFCKFFKMHIGMTPNRFRKTKECSY